MSVDDNFFNSFTVVFAALEKSFSFRDLMGSDPKTKPFIQQLTTTTVGTVLPSLIEDYGSDKKVDMMFSTSHTLFLDGFPNSKMSGIYIDKNGNWKFQINLVTNLNVETFPKKWEAVRNVYMTIVFKMKITQDSQSPFNKKISVTPKNIEIAQLKVLKGEEEMPMEQMMIQSMTNI